MSSQLPLTPLRSPSHAAGEQIARSGVAAELEWRVLDFVARQGEDGATRREISERLGVLENTVAFRLSDLKRRCLVLQSGEKEWAGFRAAKWTCTDKGRLERDSSNHQGRTP